MEFFDEFSVFVITYFNCVNTITLLKYFKKFSIEIIYKSKIVKIFRKMYLHK